jgi:hypothetical protein
MAVSRMAGIQGAEGRLLLSARKNKRYTWVPGVNYVGRYAYRIVALQAGRAGAGGHHLRPGTAGRRFIPQHGLQQSLQGRIHPGDAHKHRASTTHLEHLQGNATGGVGGDWLRRCWWARLVRRRLRWQRRGGQGSLLEGELQQPGPEVGVAGG